MGPGAAPDGSAGRDPAPGTGGNGNGGGDDVATALIVGVGLLFLIVVVLGIVIVARGLNRGDALLPSPGAVEPGVSPAGDEPPLGPGFLGYDPSRTSGLGPSGPPDPDPPPDAAFPPDDERSPDPDLPSDLAELDARLAPEAQDDPSREPGSSENHLGDRP